MYHDSIILLNDKDSEFNIKFIKKYSHTCKKIIIVLNDIFNTLYDNYDKVELFSWKDDLSLLLNSVDYVLLNSTKAYSKTELLHIKKVISNSSKYKISKIIFFSDMNIDKKNLNFIKDEIAKYNINTSYTKINFIIFKSIKNTYEILSFMSYINKTIKKNEIIISKIDDKISFKDKISLFKNYKAKKEIKNLFVEDSKNQYNIVDYGRYYKVEIEKNLALV